MEKTYVFLTLRNFDIVGGGSVRIFGILNSLAVLGYNVTLISNAKEYSEFHPSIKHIKIHNKPINKALFQFNVAILPYFIVRFLYNSFFQSINTSLKKINNKQPIYFFEYLDNSIGYILKKNNFIKAYINDVHGISTIEFDYQRKNGKSYSSKIIGNLKYIIAKIHDRKVFENAQGIIFGSKEMEIYFKSLYKLDLVKSYILPYLISKNNISSELNIELKKELIKQNKIKSTDFIFFFAGGFKLTSGLDDLITAFDELSNKYENLKLIIIGNGPLKPKVDELLNNKNLDEKVIKIESVPYKDLYTYQNLSNVIVCPDKYNKFSDLILHLKYLDSLLSGKVVINGGFKSVKEINIAEELSLNFEPSNLESLKSVMEYAYLNYDNLNLKYEDVNKYVIDKLSYESHIDSVKL